MGMPGPLWVTGTDPDMTGGSGKIQSQLIQVSKLSGIRIHTEATLNKKLQRNVLQNIFRLLPNVSSRFFYSWSSTIHILILLLRFWFSMCYSSQFSPKLNCSTQWLQTSECRPLIVRDARRRGCACLCHGPHGSPVWWRARAALHCARDGVCSLCGYKQTAL